MNMPISIKENIVRLYVPKYEGIRSTYQLSTRGRERTGAGYPQLPVDNVVFVEVDEGG